jgi:NHLM bacteriocin system ABC transporter peptidase/ATP-binding protein
LKNLFPSSKGRVKTKPLLIRPEMRNPEDHSSRSLVRVKTPTLIQMEAVECGAASLGIILRHFGHFVPLEILRVECGVSRDGSKASNILRAARRYGLEAKGFKCEPEKLRDMEMPAVVFWNFNHFLVVEGFRGNTVFLNDPAYGPRKVTLEEFDQSFTGVVLTFKRGAEFETGGRKPNLINGLKSRLGGAFTPLSFLVITGLAMVVPGLILPTFSRLFVDNVLISNMHGWVKPLLIGLTVTALFRALLTGLQQHCLLRLETKIALVTSSRFFWHILRLPIAFFSQRSAGDIGSRVAVNDTVARMLSGELATVVINVMLIGFYALLMAQYDLVMTFVGVCIAALNFIFLLYMGRRRVDENMRLLQDRGKLVGTAMDGLQLIETLKASGLESDFFSKWSGYQAKVVNGEQRMGVMNAVLMAFPPVLGGINTAILLGIGAFRIMDGNMTIGMLVAFQSLMQSFLTPVAEMVNQGSEFQQLEGDMTRIDDVLDHELAQNRGTEETPDRARLSGHVEITDLTFGYSPLAPPLIEGFSLKLAPGERVALVGGSGSGKSTISNVVAGLYESWGGTVLFDGKPREEIPATLMANSLAMVDQDISMFSGSIRDNLTMWDATVPEIEILNAARDAGIHHDITSRTGGYDSLVDEGGKNFSGGQRQRMEIARALTVNPSILILDEATSALDTESEKWVDSQIRQRGCTCIIVAHRLSTIRDCDEIIVLEKGKVVERGTHEEMKVAGGPYSRLIRE